jgi:hypothetical protein
MTITGLEEATTTLVMSMHCRSDVIVVSSTTLHYLPSSSLSKLSGECGVSQACPNRAVMGSAPSLPSRLSERVAFLEEVIDCTQTDLN